jgi:pyocin large subunit-like protein
MIRFLSGESRYWRMVRRERPYRCTNGFKGGYEAFHRHYRKHKAELHVKNEVDYARVADELWRNPIDPNVDECLRSHDGARIRYSSATGILGIVHPGDLIGTCFRPNTGRKYFENECKR